MPKVGGKTFPYTPEGMKAAKAYAEELAGQRKHATRGSRYEDAAKATMTRLRA